ncbi:MAG TPA: hypothetical protein VMV47_07100 [Bacteroidales bacterium]|nr:hypothetical protein [Bacteroidales bacterium]
MKNYPKNRKPSGYAICSICGKRFVARGLGTHKREAHKMVIRKVNYYSKKTPITTVNGKPTIVNVTRIHRDKSFKPLSNNPKAEQLLSETFENKGTSCNQIRKTRLYTETDLWILYGRISLVFYSSFYPPHIMKWRLIKDFEDRFKCNFDDVKKANPHICPDKEFAKDRDLRYKLTAMKYSR